MDRAGGIFIVIEGTDGSGKGTQFKKLTERLIAEGHDVAAFDFPQYELPSSYFVKEYLNGRYGDANAVGPYTGSLFYALDRFEAAPKIQQALADGKVVLANRYVGSNMAHQGTKFRHAEERRGYFIWLDNLEFEMLRSPRPTLSFVLRVPADIAQGLVDQKETRNYTDKKRDIHEADLSHLQKAVEVYDDMCQLFPKDFSRIDCTRDNQMLDINTIHEIIWQKVRPMLPPPSGQPGTLQTNAPLPESTGKSGQSSPTAAATSQPHTHASAQSAELILDVTSSSFLAQTLAGTQGVATIEQPLSATTFTEKNDQGAYRYHTPGSLNPNVREQYQTYMNQLFGLHAELVEGLTAYLQETLSAPVTNSASPESEAATREKARQQRIAALVRDAVLPVLPVAATRRLTVRTDTQALEQLILQLFSNQLPETRDVGTQLLAEAHKQASNLFARTGTSDQGGAEIIHRATAYEHIDKLAKAQLPEQYSEPAHPVRLVDIWPRNELDLVADMLYEHSNLSLAEIRQQVSEWPYAKKLEIFEAYIGNTKGQALSPYSQLGQAFEKARYTWDIIGDFDTLCSLNVPQAALRNITQQLTPRYGYDVPQLIDDAGLTDTFEHCFDLSLRLHSLLQQNGYTLEAQYATLHGHALRWSCSLSACELFELYHRATASGRASSLRLLQRMHEKLAETHPIIAENLPNITAATSRNQMVDLEHTNNYNVA